MKTRIMLLFLLFFLSSFSLWGQGNFFKPKAKIGFQVNPYYTKIFAPLPGHINQTKVVARVLMGVGAETYLHDRIGLRMHLMLGRIKSIKYPGVIYTPSYIPEEDLIVKRLDFYTDLGVSIRVYSKKNRSRTRAFLEMGIGNEIWVYGESSYPFHSDQVIAGQVRKSKLNYGSFSMQFGGGLEVRFFKFWGVESAVWGRQLLMVDDFYYGVKLGINRYLK